MGIIDWGGRIHPGMVIIDRDGEDTPGDGDHSHGKNTPGDVNHSLEDGIYPGMGVVDRGVGSIHPGMRRIHRMMGIIHLEMEKIYPEMGGCSL